ncbi:MAG: MiaB/RimO family radical SAM methylthiotransferase [Candidatus Nealsonbacteria bacterium]|nr:MiaB/RimO family radical SAM methylthiotransferase [Candidatus Nealsonbacteria bacterium]
MKKYWIITFGCQMNKSDSERIAAGLEKDGYKPASKMDEADLIVVNMCSVRQPAVDRIFGLNKKLSQLKTTNYKLKTILTGCILKKDKIKFNKIFDEIWEKPKKISIPSKFIPISNGCDNFCAYCVVPRTRGRLVCRGYKEIIKEINESAAKGFKEIWLLGENVNRYRSGSVNFAKLLKMADDISGDFKIRFMSPNPADFSDELIDVMAKCQKISHYLNLPAQSGDNEILKKMNRPYTAEQYIKLVKKIREKIPDINLSTDVIVGFPGETKKQFENTVKLFKKIKFDIAYISKYSPRSGTAAFRLKDDVPIKEKKRREKILMKMLK